MSYKLLFSLMIILDIKTPKINLEQFRGTLSVLITFFLDKIMCTSFQAERTENFEKDVSPQNLQMHTVI